MSTHITLRIACPGSVSDALSFISRTEFPECVRLIGVDAYEDLPPSTPALTPPGDAVEERADAPDASSKAEAKAAKDAEAKKAKAAATREAKAEAKKAEAAKEAEDDLPVVEAEKVDPTESGDKAGASGDDTPLAAATLDELRAALSGAAERSNIDTVRKIMSEAGYAKAGDVPEAARAALVAKFEAVNPGA